MQARIIEFRIRPIPKPRMTKSDRWKGRDVVKRYYAYKDELNILARRERFELPNEFCIEFYLAMPTYWSTKKKLEYDGKPHQRRPDIDNLLKAFMDALEEEDCDVWNVHVKKYWGLEDKIVIKIKEYGKSV